MTDRNIKIYSGQLCRNNCPIIEYHQKIQQHSPHIPKKLFKELIHKHTIHVKSQPIDIVNYLNYIHQHVTYEQLYKFLEQHPGLQFNFWDDRLLKLFPGEDDGKFVAQKLAKQWKPTRLLEVMKHYPSVNVMPYLKTCLKGYCQPMKKINSALIMHYLRVMCEEPTIDDLMEHFPKIDWCVSQLMCYFSPESVMEKLIQKDDCSPSNFVNIMANVYPDLDKQVWIEYYFVHRQVSFRDVIDHVGRRGVNQFMEPYWDFVDWGPVHYPRTIQMAIDLLVNDVTVNLTKYADFLEYYDEFEQNRQLYLAQYFARRRPGIGEVNQYVWYEVTGMIDMLDEEQDLTEFMEPYKHYVDWDPYALLADPDSELDDYLDEIEERNRDYWSKFREQAIENKIAFVKFLHWLKKNDTDDKVYQTMQKMSQLSTYLQRHICEMIDFAYTTEEPFACYMI